MRSKIVGRLPKIRSNGHTEFWRDHHHRFNAIVVECDDPNFAVIAAFKFKTREEEQEQLKAADRLLERVKSGKVDYRVLSRKVREPFVWDRRYDGNRDVQSR